MTLTAKPIETTLNRPEQQELRRFMKEPGCLFGVRRSEKTRRKLVESLASKGYLILAASREGFDYYGLNTEQA
jgi:hypothetical protein